MRKLKELRQEKHLKQKELAQLLGVSDKSICAYENGIASPKIETLIKMSKFFNCSIDYLLDNNTTDQKEKILSDDDILLEEYQKLNDNNKKAVQNFIKITIETQNIELVEK